MRPTKGNRGLKPEKIIETIDLLDRRIGDRFPGSGLRGIATELLQIAKEAVERADSIRRPNRPLQVMIALLLVTVGTLLFAFLNDLQVNRDIFELEHFVQSVDSSLASIVYIGAAIVFLFTLELRIKRKRLLDAIHELRALAHIVDMHQLTKDPERIVRHTMPTEVGSTRAMTPFELGRYLDYCSELLSLISKVGAIYAQDFPDAVAVEAVDELSVLTNGLARNIWQKIMILETIVGPDRPVDTQLVLGDG